MSLANPSIDGTNCYYANTWSAPRSGGRSHEGVDIISAYGTPVYAPLAGRVIRSQGSLAGNQAKLVAADGTYFIYAHLSSYEDSAPHGATVPAGAVLGYVGHTGNTTVNHLHFEVHPFGGRAVDPTPIVAAVNTCGSKVANDALRNGSPWSGTTTTVPATTRPSTTTTTTTTTTIPRSTIASIGSDAGPEGDDVPAAQIVAPSGSGSGGAPEASRGKPTATTTTVPPATTRPSGGPTTTEPFTGSRTYQPAVMVLAETARIAADHTIGVAVVGFPGIPAGASMTDVTITMRGTGTGQAAVWPCGQRAGIATGIALQPVTAGESVSRVSVAPGEGGRICLVSTVSATYEVALNGIS